MNEISCPPTPTRPKWWVLHSLKPEAQRRKNMEAERRGLDSVFPSLALFEVALFKPLKPRFSRVFENPMQKTAKNRLVI